MRMLLAIIGVGLALIGAEAWAQTAPTRPALPAAIPTLPTQAARPNAPCRPMRFELCSSANLPLGKSIATPPPLLVELHSFTADQAENAIEALGYYGVTELYHDLQGKWHGRAFREGKALSVTLDLNGNVIANSITPTPRRKRVVP